MRPREGILLIVRDSQPIMGKGGNSSSSATGKECAPRTAPYRSTIFNVSRVAVVGLSFGRRGEPRARARLNRLLYRRHV